MKTLDRLEHYRQLYAERRPGWKPATARYQGWVAEHLHPTSRVLDLGCGRGGVVERLHRMGTWTGLDPDVASLHEHRVVTLPRAQADAARLPVADATYDLVICSWVLEHLETPGVTFREITRVLRPGGRWIFLTPNARHPLPRLGQWLASIAKAQRRLVPKVYGRAAEDAFPVYYRANTPGHIARLATVAGLHLVRLELVADPSYLAWDQVTFQLATVLAYIIPVQCKVHLIGEYMRPQKSQRWSRTFQSSWMRN